MNIEFTFSEDFKKRINKIESKLNKIKEKLNKNKVRKLREIENENLEY